MRETADLKVLGKTEVKIPSIGLETWGIGELVE